jgi:isoquinoline 1-oxidoreductase beta subunit
VRLSRRAFIAGLGAGLVVSVGGFAGAAEPKTPHGQGPSPAAKQTDVALAPNVLVHIALDGTTTIVCHRSEMGQGVRSSIPVLIADELGADPARVVVVQATGDAKFGDQNTDGSSSIRKSYELLRQAGAAARMMLTSAAAARWKVNPGSIIVENHEVTHPASKRVLPFSALVAAAAKLPVPKPDKIVLRPASELRHVNASNLPLLDGADMVTGKAQFGADIVLPGMLVAVIARPPVVGGKVGKLDDSRATQVPGVRRVVEMPQPKRPWLFQPWGGVAVVADNTWAAQRGRAALDITWDHGDNGSFSSSTFRDELLASVRAPGTVFRTKGDVDAAFKSAAKTVEAEYLVPHLSHLQMEPLVAIASVGTDGLVEVWAPTQDPQQAREDVAKLLGTPLEKVTIHVTLLGGGFGRKSKTDFIQEAAYLAKQLGAPVRVQWTREDDVRHGYYNACNAQRLRAALDDKGAVTAWHHRTALTPIASTFDPTKDTASAGDLQQGVLDVALAAPNVRAEACKAPAHSRVGWYRSVYNIFHAFAVGSFIDELAHARNADPRDVWLDVIGPAKIHSLADLGVDKLANYGEQLGKHPVDAGRLRRVIERVTEISGWSARKANGRVLGLAAHRSFVTYAACVISVVPDKQRKLRIDEAWIAMDAGTVVNQERVHAQMEGSVVMGISNAMFGGITMTNGATDQSNFRDARIARMRDVPATIHTDLIASIEPPSGVGEPGVPPVAPAVANAIFALTGQRIREIPLARALGI